MQLPLLCIIKMLKKSKTGTVAKYLIKCRY